MANTKQAQKMVRKTVRQTRYNKIWKTKVKNKIKNLETALNSKDLSKADVKKRYTEFQKIVDKTVSKGIFHKNKINRLKKSMSKKVKTTTDLKSSAPKLKDPKK